MINQHVPVTKAKLPSPSPQTLTCQQAPLPPKTTTDWINDITIPIGVLVAAFTAIVAARSYRRGKRSQREAQVNSMFREMLAMEFQLYSANFNDPSKFRAAQARFESFKMWVLEEMYIWLKHKRLRAPVFGTSKIEYYNEIKTWEDTITHHIVRCDRRLANRFDGVESCYDQDFKEFVNAKFKIWNGIGNEISRKDGIM